MLTPYEAYCRLRLTVMILLCTVPFILPILIFVGTVASVFGYLIIATFLA